MGLGFGSTSQQYLDMNTGIGFGLCPCLGLWFHYIILSFSPKQTTDSSSTMKREERAIRYGYIKVGGYCHGAVAGVRDKVSNNLNRHAYSLISMPTTSTAEFSKVTLISHKYKVSQSKPQEDNKGMGTGIRPGPASHHPIIIINEQSDTCGIVC